MMVALTLCLDRWWTSHNANTFNSNRSFFAGRRASAFSGTAWAPTNLGNDLRMWLNPSDTSTTTFQSGSNALLSISDASSVGTTININNTPQQGTEDNKEIIVFDHASNEYLSTGSFAIASNGNHWAIFAGEIASVNSAKDSIWSFDTTQSQPRDYAISSGNVNDFNGELDLDGLSSNRISSNAGNLIEFTAQTPIAASTNVIVVTFFNKTGSQIGVRVNGTNAFTPETDYDNDLKNNQLLRIFRNRGSQTFGGTMYEFMSVKGLPGTGGTDMTYIEEAEGYVAHKWGAESLLPVSHPYKNTAPTTITVVVTCKRSFAPLSRNRSSWLTSSFMMASAIQHEQGYESGSDGQHRQVLGPTELNRYQHFETISDHGLCFNNDFIQRFCGKFLFQLSNVLLQFYHGLTTFSQWRQLLSNTGFDVLSVDHSMQFIEQIDLRFTIARSRRFRLFCWRT